MPWPPHRGALLTGLSPSLGLPLLILPSPSPQLTPSCLDARQAAGAQWVSKRNRQIQSRFPKLVCNTEAQRGMGKCGGAIAAAHSGGTPVRSTPWVHPQSQCCPASWEAPPHLLAWLSPARCLPGPFLRGGCPSPARSGFSPALIFTASPHPHLHCISTPIPSSLP